MNIKKHIGNLFGKGGFSQFRKDVEERKGMKVHEGDMDAFANLCRRQDEEINRIMRSR